MKRDMNYIMLTLFVMFVIFFSSAHSNENDWRLEVKLEKQNYVLYEYICLDITITNSTNETLSTHGLRAPNHLQFMIELRDDNGKLVEYTGPEILMGPSLHQLRIEPGKQDYGSFNLLDLFHSIKQSSDYKMLRGIHCIPPGVYSVRVYFEGSESEDISFNVLEPLGEDKVVLKLMEDASRIWSRDNPYPSGRIFQEIVNKYPNSVFLEQCYYLARLHSTEVWNGFKNGTFDNKDFKKELLEKFPNSGFSKERISFLIYKLSDSAKMEFLDSIQAKDSNMRSSKFIRLMQNRIAEKKGRE